jgi:hypothetical protein
MRPQVARSLTNPKPGRRVTDETQKALGILRMIVEFSKEKEDR